TVKVFQPDLVHAPHEVAHHQGVDVTVGQHHETGLQRRQDNVLQLIGEIGRIEQAHGDVTENVDLLRLLELLAHQRRSLQAHLDSRMAASLQPQHQARDLGRTPRSVRSFDDDEFTRQLFQIDSGNAVAVK